MFLFSLQLVQHIFSCLASIASILATQIEEKIVREGGWRHSQRKQNTHGLLYYSEKYVPWKIQLSLEYTSYIGAGL